MLASDELINSCFLSVFSVADMNQSRAVSNSQYGCTCLLRQLIIIQFQFCLVCCSRQQYLNLFQGGNGNEFIMGDRLQRFDYAQRQLQPYFYANLQSPISSVLQLVLKSVQTFQIRLIMSLFSKFSKATSCEATYNSILFYHTLILRSPVFK